MKNSYWDAVSWKKATNFCIWMGVFLRLYHYLLNRSLFGDEAYVALNIIHRDFFGLLQPLEYGQRAPLGYLWVVESFSYLFGFKENVLRLFSLIAGVASLFLFKKVFRHNFAERTVFIAVFILAFSEPLLYYSSELKQYMGELLVTILAILLCIPKADKESNLEIIKYSLVGALLVWFSFPVIFVLMSISLSITILQVLNKDRKGFLRLIPVYACWGSSFLINYFFFVEGGANDKGLQEFWDHHFMPLSPQIFYWFARAAYQTLDTPLGLDYSLIGFFSLGIGIIIVIKTNPKFGLILLFSLLFTLTASLFHKYPFHKRFLLFLAPVLIIWISVGADFTMSWFSQKFYRNKNLGLIVLVILLAPPFIKAIYQVVRPTSLNYFTRQDIRPVIQNILYHRKPGERLYVHFLAMAQFRYYSYLYNIDNQLVEAYVRGGTTLKPVTYPSPYFFSSTFNAGNISDFAPSRTNQPSWFLFSRDKWDEEKKCIEYLRNNGRQLAHFNNIRASAYLFGQP